MIKSTAQTGSQTLAVILCLVAGYLDGYGVLTLRTYVSFMSGNSTFVSVRVGEGRFKAALPASLVILFSFWGGALGTMLMRSKLRHARHVSFFLIGLLLALVFVLTAGQNTHAMAAIALLSLGTGMVNPVLSKVGTESVGLTFMTGNLNRMAGHLAAAVRREPLADAQTPNDSHLRRVRIALSDWLSFVAGAVIASLFVASCKAWVLAPPFALMLVLATVIQVADTPSGRSL